MLMPQIFQKIEAKTFDSKTTASLLQKMLIKKKSCKSLIDNKIAMKNENMKHLHLILLKIMKIVKNLTLEIKKNRYIVEENQLTKKKNLKNLRSFKRGSELSSYLNEFRQNSTSLKGNPFVSDDTHEDLNPKTRALVFKGEFYSIQRELYNIVEGEDKFKEIVRYTKLMDLPRRNELLEEYLSDEVLNITLNPDEKTAIKELLYKLRTQEKHQDK